MMRVVVHPKYRTIGLVQRLIRETLPCAGTPFVELIAVMAKHNPFAERAGMTKIAEQPPAKKALKIAEILCMLGFSVTFLGSKRCVLQKLSSQSSWEEGEIVFHVDCGLFLVTES